MPNAVAVARCCIQLLAEDSYDNYSFAVEASRLVAVEAICTGAANHSCNHDAAEELCCMLSCYCQESADPAEELSVSTAEQGLPNLYFLFVGEHCFDSIDSTFYLTQSGSIKKHLTQPEFLNDINKLLVLKIGRAHV